VKRQIHDRCDDDPGEFRLFTTSQPLGWSGFELLAGQAPPFEVVADVSALLSHHLMLNTAATPLTLETKEGGRFRNVTIAPGAVWLNPAGEGFEHNARDPMTFARLSIVPSKLERVIERFGQRLDPGYGLQDPQLEYLMRTLMLEVSGGGASGVAFSESLLTAIALRMAAKFSAAPEGKPARGALTPVRLKKVFDFVDGNLPQPLSLDQLAQVAGISPFHFAREFKRITSETPHQFVLARRLERARELLERSGLSVGEVAAEVGFSDQSHLTRWFRRRFGAPPARFAKDRAGAHAPPDGGAPQHLRAGPRR
jgi:AraC family transcriptional regulator